MVSCRAFLAGGILFAILAVSPAFADVYWLDRYGKISWLEERVRLASFARQILNDSDAVGYIYITAGRTSCKNEAKKRGIRAKNFLINSCGVPAERIQWKDTGYADEADVIFFIFPRNATNIYNPEYTPANKEQIIKNCDLRLNKTKKRIAK